VKAKGLAFGFLEKYVTARRMCRPVMLTALLALLAAPDCWAQQSAGQSLEWIFTQAQAASRRNDYASAEELYRQILGRDPSLVPARVNLGLACYWQHKNREAVAEFERALQASPGEFSALLFSGLAEIDLGEYDRASRALKAAERVADTDPLLFWGLGSLAMIHLDTNAAVLYLERSVALNPNNVRAVWLLGEAYANLAYRREEAPKVPANYAALTEQSLKWVEAHEPGSALAHVFRGDVFAARNLPGDALAEYQKAQKIDPEWPDIHLQLGSLLGTLGRTDEALAELAQQLKLHPADTRALVETGSIQCRAGNPAVAVPFLKRALMRDEANYEAHYRLGQAYVDLGECGLAVPQLERASALRPEKSGPYYLLHLAYRALKQNSKATEALEEFHRRKATTCVP
jgi:tetratricopeptide (TPR) repeat protein